MKIHSDEELDVALEAWGMRFLSPTQVQQELQEERPVAQRGCICSNGHEPDENGLIFTSVSCVLHGCRTQWPFKSQLNISSRTVGVTHGRNRD